MDYNKAALELHSKFPGKIAVQSLCECKDRDALSTAYTPGVAEPCRKIKANPDVISPHPGSAHFLLHRILPQYCLPAPAAHLLLRFSLPVLPDGNLPERPVYCKSALLF